MKMSTYTEKVRAGLADAAALADDPTKEVADKLATAVDSSTRLAIIKALGDAAAQISAQLAPGAVRLSLNGDEPVFEVVAPEPDEAHFESYNPEETEAEESDPVDHTDDEPQSRVSLRIPQSVKEKVDAAAADEGVSVNTWLLQRILMSLAMSRRGRGRGRGPRGPFGPDFPPPGMSGAPAHWPGHPGWGFGPGGWRADERDDRSAGRRRERRGDDERGDRPRGATPRPMNRGGRNRSTAG